MRFSTLYGSKWVATSVEHENRKALAMFQYPLRVEVGCNIERARVRTGGKQVSVPSTGRSGLQPGSKRWIAHHVTSFSTLYGSKWVATIDAASSCLAALSFSTLYGSKWVATF